MKVRATGPLYPKAAPPKAAPPKDPPSKRFFKPKNDGGTGPSSGGTVNPQLPPTTQPPKSSPQKDGGGRGRSSSVGSGG